MISVDGPSIAEAIKAQEAERAHRQARELGQTRLRAKAWLERARLEANLKEVASDIAERRAKLKIPELEAKLASLREDPELARLEDLEQDTLRARRLTQLQGAWPQSVPVHFLAASRRSGSPIVRKAVEAYDEVHARAEGIRKARGDLLNKLEFVKQIDNVEGRAKSCKEGDALCREAGLRLEKTAKRLWEEAAKGPLPNRKAVTEAREELAELTRQREAVEAEEQSKLLALTEALATDGGEIVEGLRV